MKSSKGSGGKGPASSSGLGAAGTKKSRWEADDKSADNRPASSSDPKPSKTMAPPSASPVAPNEKPTSLLAQVPTPSAGPRSFPLPDRSGTPPPSYGFHNLERRTITLADGSARSYFSLPLDTPFDPAADKFPFGRPGFGPGLEPVPGLGFDRRFPPPSGGRFSPEDFRQFPPFVRGPVPHRDYPDPIGPDGPRNLSDIGAGSSSLKRKYGQEDEFLWHRQQVMQHGNLNGIPLGPSVSDVDRSYFLRASTFRRDQNDELRFSKQVKLGGESHEVPSEVLDVDPRALKRAFLWFSKMINENFAQRKKYLADRKDGPLLCVACGRASKDFADVHELIMHTYTLQNADLHVDHLGLHKALCVLMGWNYSKAPDNSKAYQLLSADNAQANRDDLIVWPPTVILHNIISGRRKDGCVEYLRNIEIDSRLKDMGFSNCKARAVNGMQGHTDIAVVRFSDTQRGLEEAERLVEHLEKEKHGRKGWACLQASLSGNDDNNPALVKVDRKTGKKKWILYGYLATASDFEKIDYDAVRKSVIKSRKDFSLFD
ncbi:uncharacterized protein LOC122035867 [Zingiber officinale]|uniref:XS domain-containing protein n=1 Tax=Zingiber officinale TaxID=94328 RepID=A0A8J5HXA3_ZINOF|nr:uncharacterized protein LOC122035867 [Zingiber officinale]KAG6537607.1 hypothetical protein ZIOFF_002702 [Zingiber officinale]